jgi:hypothetical protein
MLGIAHSRIALYFKAICSQISKEPTTRRRTVAFGAPHARARTPSEGLLRDVLWYVVFGTLILQVVDTEVPAFPAE